MVAILTALRELEQMGRTGNLTAVEECHQRVLSAFDVSVFCPSPTEGAPRAVILGMLASRPCLSTGAEGVADMISPEIGAILSPENSSSALRALLEGYIEDPARLQREGAAARAYAERTYAAPVVAEMIDGLLRQAIAKGR